MSKVSRPRRGSLAYSPRKRASREVPRIRSWPDGGEKPHIQGFAGYKAGMVHVSMIDERPHVITHGMEITVPATVVETPPMIIAALRFYERTPYGLKTITEIWADKDVLVETISNYVDGTSNARKVVEDYLERRIDVYKKHDKESKWKKLEKSSIADIRVLAFTQPYLITGVPKKVPDFMEIRIGGGSIEERVEYGKNVLGKDVKFTDFASPGSLVDVIAVTKGHGYQGPVKRWGIKLLHHKARKGRRKAGSKGPKTPHWVRPTVPLPGQMGYHQRTEYNKLVIKYGEDPSEINPAGGFKHYGMIRTAYVLVHGSTPGPVKRLIRFRDAVRNVDNIKLPEPKVTYISTWPVERVIAL